VGYPILDFDPNLTLKMEGAEMASIWYGNEEALSSWRFCNRLRDSSRNLLHMMAKNFRNFLFELFCRAYFLLPLILRLM